MRALIKLPTACACLAAALLAGCAASNSKLYAVAEPIDVVFVCQYGYAKSLVAAKHFERLAGERGLPVRVVARGFTPNANVPEPLARQLASDGFDVAAYQPRPLTPSDLVGAEHVVTFGVAPPPAYSGRAHRWDAVPALGEDYPRARDEILALLQPLLNEIEREARKAGSRAR